MFFISFFFVFIILLWILPSKLFIYLWFCANWMNKSISVMDKIGKKGSIQIWNRKRTIFAIQITILLINYNEFYFKNYSFFAQHSKWLKKIPNTLTPPVSGSFCSQTKYDQCKSIILFPIRRQWSHDKSHRVVQQIFLLDLCNAFCT